MLLLSGVLLFCGAMIALVWSYEVNRRVPMPRWARVELIWETLLATAIGAAMVGILLLVKYVPRLRDPAALASLELLAALVALGATMVLAWYLLRPLRRRRAAARQHEAPARPGNLPGHPPQAAA
ncbi:MAG: hypothetical protein WD100_01950 [Tistlia sp.]|uniref:hypothetical protein n=1 Tax=Tistlia sp. TaxID=3057121 RepID=UPI0034A27FEE